MKYIDNNNAQSDKYLLENNNYKIPDRNYFLNKPNNYSPEYLGFQDPDYFSLLKQYSQDANVDEVLPYKKQTNGPDINQPPVKQQDFNKISERTLNDKWLNQHEKLLNSSDSILNASDDEALENYLNDLAKNYDDIDRRIRNAEKFVTKMEESQNSNYNTLNGFNKIIPNQTLHENVEMKSDKKMKYVTELRVNISDNLVKEPITCVQDPLFATDQTGRKFNGSAQKIKHYREPVSRKMSFIYSNPMPVNRSNLAKSNCKTAASRQNYINVTSNCQSQKSDDSSLSNSVKLDLEYIDIPPPKIFSSYFGRNETTLNEKEIQTTSIGFTSNFLSKYAYEEVAVQTTQVFFRDEHQSIDKGVSTESEYFKPRLKPNGENISVNKKSPYPNNLDFSETERDEVYSKSEKMDCSDKVLGNFQSDKLQMKSTIPRKLNERKFLQPNDNPTGVQTKLPNIVKPAIQNILKPDKAEVKRKKSVNSTSKLKKMKNLKMSPQSKIGKEVIETTTKTSSKYKTDLESELLDKKDSAKNASFEIQRLLENLGTHLQASMSLREPRAVVIKSPTSTDSSSASFWDNPLQKNDLISAKVTPVKIKSNESGKKGKKSNNIINSELQAICKTIEKNKKYDSRSVNVSNLSCSDSESLKSVPNNIQTLRSESLDNRQLKKSTNSPNRPGVTIKKSVSNINVSGDMKFPSNFKVFRSFELNPYDDIIKAHLSPFDRRVKSVAAKNACRIVIEGPINSYDPISCQAFRNKVIYRCTVAGPYKENLDKCMNYLKETFPNTFLKVNSRSG